MATIFHLPKVITGVLIFQTYLIISKKNIAFMTIQEE
jgi:hypothetical protein